MPPGSRGSVPFRRQPAVEPAAVDSPAAVRFADHLLREEPVAVRVVQESIDLMHGPGGVFGGLPDGHPPGSLPEVGELASELGDLEAEFLDSLEEVVQKLGDRTEPSEGVVWSGLHGVVVSIAVDARLSRRDRRRG